MKLQRIAARRPASIMPLVVLCLVAMCGFLALSIDIGMMLVARTQAQNAADAAAMTGARTLNGSSNSNEPNAKINAAAVAELNSVLSQAVQASEVTVVDGSYDYDATSQVFVINIPPIQKYDNSTTPPTALPLTYNLSRVTVTPSRQPAFSRVLGVTSLNVSATATAAHRPRDVCLVLDYSGSMNNESDLWNNEGYLTSANNSPNNNDTVYPQWAGHSASNANMVNTQSDSRVGRSNVTITALGVPPLVNDFYQNAFGATTGIPAFNPAPTTVTNTAAGGDKPLFKKNSTTVYAQTVAHVTGGNSNPFNGHKSVNGSWTGYTQGPGYYGMTFYNWPPDPDPTKDWRKLYFLKTDGATKVDDNTILWNSSGQWNDPQGNYVINYKAILAWISANLIQSSTTDPKPFPPILRGGHLLYYDAVPTDVPAGAYDHTQKNYSIAWANQNQRFWKEYIDYTLGVWRDPFGNIQRPGNPSCSIGPDIGDLSGESTWGTVQITGPDQSGLSNGPPNGTGSWKRINPTDNPQRPRHRFWFGPMTMIQYMSDTGLFPGTTHDISMYPCKLGLSGAIQDVSNNHPNDLVSLLPFSRPHFTGEAPEVAAFTLPQYSLTRNYSAMINSLWFPPNASTGDVRPWDTNGMQTPRAHADYCANTTSDYGLMLAYNQLSGTSYYGTAGGGGRKGATRIVIFETDGMANQVTTCGFSQTVTGTGSAAVNNSYYKIAPTDTVSAGAGGYSNAGPAAIAVAKKMCAQVTDTANGPGFGTPTKSVILHVVVFGAIFEPITPPPPDQTNGMDLAQQLSTIGGTGFPSSITATSDPNYYKICTGDLTTRQTKLKNAFTSVMDSSVPVSLIK